MIEKINNASLATGAMQNPAATASMPWLWLSRRLTNTLGALACFLMLGFGYFMQYVMHLEPCPMCILQRIAILATGCIFAVAALHNPQTWGARVYGGLLGLSTGIGAALSIRHIYLQYFLPPDADLACGMALDYMLDTFSLGETLTMILRGTGDCTEVVWTFLGLSIPSWTLICFVVLGTVGVLRNGMRV